MNPGQLLVIALFVLLLTAVLPDIFAGTVGQTDRPANETNITGANATMYNLIGLVIVVVSVLAIWKMK